MGLFVDITKRFSDFDLNVCFEANEGVVGLLGASGSGKSMTLKCIAGIERPDRGKIILNDRVLFDSEKGVFVQSRLRKTGYLFQNYALFPNMTVEENIGFALKNASKNEKNKIIYDKISMLKLEGLEKRHPSQLSGGQQQRVALARALAVDPEVLLLDEPFSALDDHLRNHMVMQLADNLLEYGGVTLFVTHNMDEAYRLCNNLVVLASGKIEAKGYKEDIFKHPVTITTAKLTGCKNFSRIKRLSSNQIDAYEWGIKLIFHDEISKTAEYVGIRAHYLRLASNDDKENVIKCSPAFVSETPFRRMIYLKVWGSTMSSGESYLQWDVSKEEWDNLENMPIPWNVCLEADKLMTLEK